MITMSRLRIQNFQSLSSFTNTSDFINSSPNHLLNLNIIGLPRDPKLFIRLWSISVQDQWLGLLQSPTANSLERSSSDQFKFQVKNLTFMCGSWYCLSLDNSSAPCISHPYLWTCLQYLAHWGTRSSEGVVSSCWMNKRRKMVHWHQSQRKE